jgi:uncharacterized membrane protein
MLQEQETATEPATRAPSVYRDPLTWAIAACVFGAYATISLYRLFQLDPSSWDLGIFTELIKQYAHFHAPIVDVRGAGTSQWGDHFSPALVLLAPFFRVFPTAATLLVFQALFAAISVFPVAAAARLRLGAGQARTIALAYGFCWGLQQMINFDFHEIALAIPLLAFSLSALVLGRLRSCVLWALPLVFVKEDQGFTLAALGLVLVVSGALADERTRIRAGQLLLAWGLLWSFLAIVVIIPHFNADHHFYYWKDGGVFAPGQHFTVSAAVRQFFHAWPVKLLTTITMLLPTAFVALRSPLVLVAVPSLLLRFESSNSAYWGTYWHYSATVMPVLFVAAVDGLVRIRAAIAEDAGLEAEDGLASDGAASGGLAPGGAGEAGAGAGEAGASEERARAGWASGAQGWWRATQAGALRFGAAMMVAVAVPLAMQYPLSGLWNAQTYRISSHVAAADEAMSHVPDGVTVQTTLNMLASLAARTDTYWIGNAGNPATQYIVFDQQNSGYSPAITDVPAFIASLYPSHHYQQIFADDGVYVFERTSP